MSELEWAQLFARVARELASLQDSEHTLQRIAELATRVTGCEWAAIARAAEPAPVVAATSDVASAELIAKIQASGGGGPTWEAVRHCETIYVPDLVRETRWVDHVLELLDTTPVRSILAICLQLDGEPVGALTLYAARPDAFPPPLQEISTVYADHATIAIDNARAGEHVDNLETALKSSREIGVAIGILMERHKITTEQAFDMLRIASQHTHRKLREVASDLVRTGELVAE